MATQQNLSRALTLIRLLKQRPGKTLNQLGQLLGCTPRHVRRFLDALEAVGFHVDTEGKHPPRYYLFEDERRQQADFTEEEAQLLRQALTAYPDHNPLVLPLRQKIFTRSTLFPLADTLADQHQSRVVNQLAEAIRNRLQARLLRYFSANSNTISDRVVEPFGFSEQYDLLTAYDPDAGKVKTFKTQRIGDVAVLDVPQTYAPAEAPTDPFLWPGEPRLLTLHLTQLARHLLLEEHPLTQPDIHPNPTDETYPYTYAGQVRSWVGVGRFVLGLPGQVRLTDAPADFRTYLQGRIGEFDI
ncbi:helix-turn-helix transcriptional regulator [Fibrella sp. WM1]|uniref:helix-turn-helix transcriptional regulator n=1 Tax=Fibrella musci TaxID=3242485 RepID=UPI0035210BD3